MEEKNLNFDEVIDRRNTDCLKFDFAERRGKPADVLPLWVADMDFKTSSLVLDALTERVQHGIFGYTESRESYFEAVSKWMEAHHGTKLADKDTGCCICTGDGGQSIFQGRGCRSDPAAGLLSVFRSDP